MGKNLLECDLKAQDAEVPDRELVQRVAESTGLSLSESARVVDDVLAWHREPVADYVRRRHRQLKTRGMRNEAVFEQIAVELEQRTVAAPPQSMRQLRRIVYG